LDDDAKAFLKAAENFASCKIVNHLHSASISIDRRAVLRLWEVKPKASIPSVAPQVDARFPDPPAAVRSVFLQIKPKQLLPLRIEETHICAIDLFAFLCCRLGPAMSNFRSLCVAKT
jgi:hypothetical protein